MNSIIVIFFIIYSAVLISLKYLILPENRYRCLIRKSVHLTTGLAIFSLTYYFNKQTILILIIAGTILSIISYRFKKISFIHTTSGTSLGTLFYPIGLLTSYLLLYDMPDYYFRLTLMILSISDTVANFTGRIKKLNKRFTILKEEKSTAGVIGFAISAFFLHLIFIPDTQTDLYLYIMLSVIAAVNFEIVSFRGSDNFTIPAGCSLFFLLTHDKTFDPSLFIILIPLIASGTAILFKKNVLTRYGSIAAYILGLYLVTLPGNAWIIPVITFFLSSVVFTKINGLINHKTEDTNRRNIWQVFANIFFAVISSILFLILKNELFIYFYITLVATVTADTWASEIGPVFSKRSFSLAHFNFKESGISGGVSIPGTIAALAGSAFISILSYYLFFQTCNYNMIALLAISGFAAVFVDSLLSAFLEPVLLNMNYFRKIRGDDSPTPNDIVNISASLTAPVFFILLTMIIS